MDGHHRHAQGIQCPPVVQKVGPVVQQQAHPVAVAIARRLIGLAPLRHGGQGLPVGHGARRDAVLGSGHIFGEQQVGLRLALAHGLQHRMHSAVGSAGVQIGQQHGRAFT